MVCTVIDWILNRSITYDRLITLPFVKGTVIERVFKLVNNRSNQSISVLSMIGTVMSEK